MDEIKSIYDLRKYNSQTIDTFEIIGSYIANVYYNSIYSRAKQLFMQHKCESITEAYKTLIMGYLSQFKDPNQVKLTVNDLYKSFTVYRKSLSESYKDWIDNVSKEFIPSDYWKSLSNDKKIFVIMTVFENSVKDFTKYIQSPRIMNAIIDNHNDKNNVNILQNQLIHILIDQREMLYQSFVDQLTKTSASADVLSKVNKKLKDEIKLLTKTNKDYEERDIKQSNIIKKIKIVIDKYRNELDYLKRRIKHADDEKHSMTIQIEQLKKDLFESQETLRLSSKKKSPKYTRQTPQPAQQIQNKISTNNSFIFDDNLNTKNNSIMKNTPNDNNLNNSIIKNNPNDGNNLDDPIIENTPSYNDLNNPIIDDDNNDLDDPIIDDDDLDDPIIDDNDLDDPIIDDNNNDLDDTIIYDNNNDLDDTIIDDDNNNDLNNPIIDDNQNDDNDLEEIAKKVMERRRLNKKITANNELANMITF